MPIPFCLPLLRQGEEPNLRIDSRESGHPSNGREGVYFSDPGDQQKRQQWPVSLTKPKNRDRKTRDSQRRESRDRILCFFSPPGNRAIFSTFWGDFLTKLHSKPGEKGKKIHWRKFKKVQWRQRPEIADFCPLSWSNVS